MPKKYKYSKHKEDMLGYSIWCPLIWLHTMMGSFVFLTVLFQSYTSCNQANTMLFTWSICLRRFIALSNSSTMVLRAGLAPAAHWSRWEIRNCWLLILSITLVNAATICSWRTWISECRMRDEHHNNRHGQKMFHGIMQYKIRSLI